MADIIKHLLDTAGDTALKSGIGAIFGALAAGAGKILSRKDKEKIEKAAERMIQAATMDDVRRYAASYRVARSAKDAQIAPQKAAARSSVHRKIARKISVTAKKAPAKEKREGAAKKLPASKATHRNAPGKVSTQKTSPTKRSKQQAGVIASSASRREPFSSALKNLTIRKHGQRK